MKKYLSLLLSLPLVAFGWDSGPRNEYYDYPSYRAFEYSRDHVNQNQRWQQQMEYDERQFDYQLQQQRGFSAFENQLIFGDGFTGDGY